MQQLLLTFSLLMLGAIGRSQVIERYTTPSLEWRFSVTDFPYVKDAAQAEANNRAGVTAGIISSGHFSVFADLSYKTKGWVFANPYFDDNFSGRIGLKINTGD